MVMQELETALAHHAPPQVKEDPSLHELPPLVVDGIPTPVEKMTQAQLRAFIPLMLKYSTGRGKPGWGKDSTRPPWWPQDLPWANVRSDARNDEEKQKVFFFFNYLISFLFLIIIFLINYSGIMDTCSKTDCH